MIVLGINENHNATAAIVKDGTVLACVAEERFTGIKNDVGYPLLSINYLLESTGTKADQLDSVVIAGFEQDPLGLRLKRHTRFTIKDYLNEMYEYWHPKLIDGKDSDFWERMQLDSRLGDSSGVHYNFDFLQNTPKSQWQEAFREERKRTVIRHLGVAPSNVSFAEHHSCHSHYAYFGAQIDRSVKTAVVVADGWGDGNNATISVAQGNTITEIHKTNMCHLGRIYRWTTLLLGMRPNEHEYKLMGLAPYAKDYIRRPAYEIFADTIAVDGIDFKWKNRPSDMFFHFKQKFERQGVRFDGIAGGLQQWVEEMLTVWVSNIMKQLGTNQLVFSGGVAMNVKANKALADLPEVKNFFVTPSPGDESLSIGAAFVACRDKNEISPISSAYLGPAPTATQVDDALNEFSAQDKFSVIRHPRNELIAQLIADGLAIARCVGRMEFGARALGNRSILCDPSKWSNVAKINEQVKGRDFWMPFTPSILDYRAKDYLVNPKGLRAPFMTVAFNTTELARRDIPAAIHPYDHTARPQIVEKEINPEYFNLIQAFEAITGIGALLNTSLNLHGYPIVNTPRDAMHTFVSSGLDGLLLPDVLVLKRAP